jgi:hypothetical protein
MCGTGTVVDYVDPGGNTAQYVIRHYRDGVREWPQHRTVHVPHPMEPVSIEWIVASSDAGWKIVNDESGDPQDDCVWANFDDARLAAANIGNLMVVRRVDADGTVTNFG